MKKPLRQTIFGHAIALHGESFYWATVSSEYKPLMQISKSTQLVLNSHSNMSSKCDVTLELYRKSSSLQLRHSILRLQPL